MFLQNSMQFEKNLQLRPTPIPSLQGRGKQTYLRCRMVGGSSFLTTKKVIRFTLRHSFGNRMQFVLKSYAVRTEIVGGSFGNLGRQEWRPSSVWRGGNVVEYQKLTNADSRRQIWWRPSTDLLMDVSRFADGRQQTIAYGEQVTITIRRRCFLSTYSTKSQ